MTYGFNQLGFTEEASFFNNKNITFQIQIMYTIFFLEKKQVKDYLRLLNIKKLKLYLKN